MASVNTITNTTAYAKEAREQRPRQENDTKTQLSKQDHASSPYEHIVAVSIEWKLFTKEPVEHCSILSRTKTNKRTENTADDVANANTTVHHAIDTVGHVLRQTTTSV